MERLEENHCPLLSLANIRRVKQIEKGVTNLPDLFNAYLSNNILRYNKTFESGIRSLSKRELGTA
jgi:hypothetical protein